MSKSITQDMAYRQSLMKYAEKYGVSRASRKYNKSRSYIYFWKQRWDGSVASLACQSRRPHSHPNQHTEAELKLIRDMRRRNPSLGMIELWHRLRKRGYTRCPESLFRVMRKMGLFPAEKPKNPYKPKPYEQMTYPGQRVQVDVKANSRIRGIDTLATISRSTEHVNLTVLWIHLHIHLFYLRHDRYGGSRSMDTSA